MTQITRKRHLNPPRRHRTYPRAIKRPRHTSYRTLKPGDHGTRHDGPPATRLLGPKLQGQHYTTNRDPWHWLNKQPTSTNTS
jgi:hypothetical protein